MYFDGNSFTIRIDGSDTTVRAVSDLKYSMVKACPSAFSTQTTSDPIQPAKAIRPYGLMAFLCILNCKITIENQSALWYRMC